MFRVLKLIMSKRPRLTCPRCCQTVSYSTYSRHQTLAYCPGAGPAKLADSSDSDSDSTFYNSDSDSHSKLSVTSFSADEYGLCNLSNTSQSPSFPSELSDSQDESDTTAPEVWSDSESQDSDHELTTIVSEANQSVAHVQHVFCLYITFLQLCYRITDRAYLLALLGAVFCFLSSTALQNMTLKAFADTFPRILYSLRRRMKCKPSCREYVVCPRCDKLYPRDDCTIRTGSEVISRKCNHVEYPNHRQPHRRLKCGAELMKKVKIGGKYKLVPKKTYMYNPLLSSLQELVSRRNMLLLCEQWRQHFDSVPDGWLTDVYDGKLWKDWFRKERKSFP